MGEFKSFKSASLRDDDLFDDDIVRGIDAPGVVLDCDMAKSLQAITVAESNLCKAVRTSLL